MIFLFRLGLRLALLVLLGWAALAAYRRVADEGDVTGVLKDLPAAARKITPSQAKDEAARALEKLRR